MPDERPLERDAQDQRERAPWALNDRLDAVEEQECRQLRSRLFGTPGGPDRYPD